RFAYELDESEAGSPLVRALGIEADPQVTEMVEHLEKLRDSGAPPGEAMLALRYAAIGAACKRRDLMPDDMVENCNCGSCAPASVSSQASRDWCFAAGQWLSPARMRLGAQSSDIAAPSSRADRDPGSLGMVASGPGLMLRSNECVYFETGLFGVVC